MVVGPDDYQLELPAWVPSTVDPATFVASVGAQLDRVLREGYDHVTAGKLTLTTADDPGLAPEGSAGLASEQYTQEWVASFGPDTLPVSVTLELWVVADADHELVIRIVSPSRSDISMLQAAVTRILQSLSTPTEPLVINDPFQIVPSSHLPNFIGERVLLGVFAAAGLVLIVVLFMQFD